MTRSTAVAPRFRQRKLSTKQTLQVLREDDVEKAQDDETQRLISTVESGVEKHEEKEHHLQAAISASNAASVGGKIEHLYIPTPHALPASINYNAFYGPRAHKPASYIRFSSIVEDCVGASYCMTAEDDGLLKNFNTTRDDSSKVTEGQYEQVFSFFEEVAQSKQPFALVDNPPILTLEEMDGAYDSSLSADLISLIDALYPFWHEKRQKRQNRPLMPTLKTIRFEGSQEKDDSDPYICFRRRELRLSRKTRARDAQITEKLKRLRMELEDARQLLVIVHARETLKNNLLSADKRLFEQRAQVKRVKRKLEIRGDDEDLVNHRPPKKAKQPTVILEPPPKPERRPVEPDLWSLSEVFADRAAERRKLVQQKLAEASERNQGFVDWTSFPLSPPPDSRKSPEFRPAAAQYLPTPPESASSDTPIQSFAREGRATDDVPLDHAVVASHPRFSYRRRVGRGGRQMVDRRSSSSHWPEDVSDRILDRFRYAGERESDEDEVQLVDPYSTEYLTWRASLISNLKSPPPQRGEPGSMANLSSSESLGASASQGRQSKPPP